MKTNSDTTPKLYVGLDVHKEQTAVVIADPGAQGEWIRESRSSELLVAVGIEQQIVERCKNGFPVGIFPASSSVRENASGNN